MADPAPVDLLNAYSAGYTHADVTAALGSEPPRPDIGQIWGGSSAADADWLAAAGPSTSLGTTQAFQQLPGPSISDQQITGTDPISPVDNAAAQSPTAVLAAGADPGQIAPNDSFMVPGTQDQSAIGDKAPWEVPDTSPNAAAGAITNLATTPNAGPGQDI